MFEAAELGRKVSKQEFKEAEATLRTELLAAQRALRDAGFSVILVVSGVEGAGKSEVVNRLSGWLDMRGVITTSFWDETQEERERPRYWRFWRTLPPHGSIGVFYGSWYTQPIVQRVFGELDEAGYERELSRIAAFERMLAREGACIVKLWFHLSLESAERVLKKGDKKRRKALKSEWRTDSQRTKFVKRYADFAQVSERAIRMTDLGISPWNIIEAGDRRYRELRAGQLLLARLKERLARTEVAGNGAQLLEPDVPSSSAEQL
ncbi:MAG: polyphosphate:AMP phosphotransferase, partial [Planctomycetota bacterium]